MRMSSQHAHRALSSLASVVLLSLAACTTTAPAYQTGGPPSPLNFPPPAPDPASAPHFEPQWTLSQDQRLDQVGVQAAIRLPPDAKVTREVTSSALAAARITVKDEAFLTVTQYPPNEAFDMATPGERLNDAKEANAKDPTKRIIRQEANDQEWLLMLEVRDGSLPYYLVLHGRPANRMTCATSSGAFSMQKAEAAAQACRSLRPL